MPIRRNALGALAACVALALGTGGHALADPAKQRPDGWQTWTWDGNCYAINFAKGPSHSGIINPDTYIAVKHLPRERNYDNVSVVSGLGDITGIQGTIEVDGSEFPLLVYGSSGFVRSGEPEHRLIDLLNKSETATVTWYRKDGLAVQTYDIRGFAAAKKVVDTACPHAEAKPAATVAADDAPKPQAEASEAEKPAKPRAHSRRHRGR